MIIEKDSIPALLDATLAAHTVLAPRVVDGVSRFAPLSSGSEAQLDLANTSLPPKDALFPATERMYRWTRADGKLEISQEKASTEPFVLFGVRPCDVLSFTRLDDVFLTKGYIDEFYQAKRDAMTTVAIACTEPRESCFCDSMSADPNTAPGADVLMHELSGEYTVEAQTSKGEELLKLWEPFVVDVPKGSIAAATAASAPGSALSSNKTSCNLKVSMEGVCAALPELFESELWQRVANTCITCGTCTFVCPTCHCFDISQERRASEGEQFRCWDSCMFTDYTLMAGNHNPRATKSSRVRQRFMHKLCYFEQRYGSSLCVGCGRCLESCPAGVDITRIIERIGEMKGAAGNASGAEGATSAAEAQVEGKEATHV